MGFETPVDKDKIRANIESYIAKYGYGVCDAYGSEHCVGSCQDPKDCGAKPIPVSPSTP